MPLEDPADLPMDDFPRTRAARLRAALDAQPDTLPLLQALGQAHIQYLLDNLAEISSIVHLARSGPSLHRRWTNSTGVYEPEIIAWTCQRTGCAPEDLYPRVIAGVFLLAVQITVERWDPTDAGNHLAHLIRQTYETAATLPHAPRPCSPDPFTADSA